MAKGVDHTGNSKRNNFKIKKRCCVLNCKKRARKIINNKPYCRIHDENI